jgi:hypothetical protein
MISHPGKRLAAVITIMIGSMLIFHVFAFTWLKLNNKPVNLDIVVLFIGPEYEKRLNPSF